MPHPTPSPTPQDTNNYAMHFVVRVSTCVNGFSYTPQATKITGLVSDIERYIYIYLYIYLIRIYIANVNYLVGRLISSRWPCHLHRGFHSHGGSSVPQIVLEIHGNLDGQLHPDRMGHPEESP